MTAGMRATHLASGAAHNATPHCFTAPRVCARRVRRPRAATRLYARCSRCAHFRARARGARKTRCASRAQRFAARARAPRLLVRAHLFCHCARAALRARVPRAFARAARARDFLRCARRARCVRARCRTRALLRRISAPHHYALFARAARRARRAAAAAARTARHRAAAPLPHSRTIPLHFRHLVAACAARTPPPRRAPKQRFRARAQRRCIKRLPASAHLFRCCCAFARASPRYFRSRRLWFYYAPLAPYYTCIPPLTLIFTSLLPYAGGLATAATLPATRAYSTLPPSRARACHHHLPPLPAAPPAISAEILQFS